MTSKRYAVIVGARPNFIKAAPLLKTFQKHNVKFTLIHTGQHYDSSMSDVFFNQLNLPRPDVTFDGNNFFSDLREYFSKNIFDATIVFGDVDSTLAGAIASFTNGQDVFHIEAGLRSFDQTMPEERNRKVVDHISKLHFVTEPSAIDNLVEEGIDSYIEVGNIMIESLEMFSKQIDDSDILGELGLLPKKYVVLTIHRKENTNDPERLSRLLKLIEKISTQIKLVFPIHPGTEKHIYEAGLGHHLRNVLETKPLGYLDFQKLVKESAGVITDSGGIQEETTHLGIPCCTMRNNTERPITQVVGSNRLFPEWEDDVEEMLVHLSTTFDEKPVPMWDNKVSERIYENICNYANN